MNRLENLSKLGQSYWLDNLTREMILNGELENWIIEQGISGITSNPSTFNKAISNSNVYDSQIKELALKNKSVDEIYEALVVKDVQDACDMFHETFKATDGKDGFVSLEVSPHLAHATKATIDEARRLFDAVDRPNVFIKVPGTENGVPAIERLLSDGININITLLFSIANYEKVMKAYLNALEDRDIRKQPIDGITSVASFFLSRIDVLVDQLLSHRLVPGNDEHNKHIRDLMGKAAVANAKLAYQKYKRYFHGTRWKSFKSKGARTQRVLWASTSTKNDAYSDVMYVEPLIAEDSVSTMPESTLTAFADHGEAQKPTIEHDVDKAGSIFTELSKLGIDMEFVTQQLLNEGIQKFIDPFDALKQSIAAKRQQFIAKAQGKVHQKW